MKTSVFATAVATLYALSPADAQGFGFGFGAQPSPFGQTGGIPGQIPSPFGQTGQFSAFGGRGPTSLSAARGQQQVITPTLIPKEKPDFTLLAQLSGIAKQNAMGDMLPKPSSPFFNAAFVVVPTVKEIANNAVAEGSSEFPDLLSLIDDLEAAVDSEIEEGGGSKYFDAPEDLFSVSLYSNIENSNDDFFLYELISGGPNEIAVENNMPVIKPIISFDLDGTLHQCRGAEPQIDRASGRIDCLSTKDWRPNMKIVNYLKQLHNEGNEIIIVTRRSAKDNNAVINWFRTLGIDEIITKIYNTGDKHLALIQEGAIAHYDDLKENMIDIRRYMPRNDIDLYIVNHRTLQITPYD